MKDRPTPANSPAPGVAKLPVWRRHVTGQRLRAFILLSLAVHLILGMSWGVPAYVRQKRVEAEQRREAALLEQQRQAAAASLAKAKAADLAHTIQDVQDRTRKAFDNLTAELPKPDKEKTWTAVRPTLQPAEQQLALALDDRSMTDQDLRNRQADVDRQLVEAVNDNLSVDAGREEVEAFLAGVESKVVPALVTHYKGELVPKVAQPVRATAESFVKGTGADAATALGSADAGRHAIGDSLKRLSDEADAAGAETDQVQSLAARKPAAADDEVKQHITAVTTHLSSAATGASAAAADLSALAERAKPVPGASGLTDRLAAAIDSVSQTRDTIKAATAALSASDYAGAARQITALELGQRKLATQWSSASDAADQAGPRAEQAARAALAMVQDNPVPQQVDRHLAEAFRDKALQRLTGTLIGALRARLTAAGVKPDDALVASAERRLKDLLESKVGAAGGYGASTSQTLRDAAGRSNGTAGAERGRLAEAFTKSADPVIAAGVVEVVTDDSIDARLAEMVSKPEKAPGLNDVRDRVAMLAARARDGRASALDSVSLTDLRASAMARSADTDRSADSTGAPTTQEAAPDGPPLVEDIKKEILASLHAELQKLLEGKLAADKADKVWDHVAKASDADVDHLSRDLIDPKVSDSDLESRRLAFSGKFLTSVGAGLDKTASADVARDILNQLQGKAGDAVAGAYRNAVKENVGKALAHDWREAADADGAKAGQQARGIRDALDSAQAVAEKAGQVLDQVKGQTARAAHDDKGDPAAVHETVESGRGKVQEIKSAIAGSKADVDKAESAEAGSTGAGSPQAGSTTTAQPASAGSPQVASTGSTGSPQAGSARAGSPQTGSPQAASTATTQMASARSTDSTGSPERASVASTRPASAASTQPTQVDSHLADVGKSFDAAAKSLTQADKTGKDGDAGAFAKAVSGARKDVAQLRQSVSKARADLDREAADARARFIKAAQEASDDSAGNKPGVKSRVDEKFDGAFRKDALPRLTDEILKDYQQKLQQAGVTTDAKDTETLHRAVAAELDKKVTGDTHAGEAALADVQGQKFFGGAKNAKGEPTKEQADRANAIADKVTDAGVTAAVQAEAPNGTAQNAVKTVAGPDAGILDLKDKVARMQGQLRGGRGGLLAGADDADAKNDSTGLAGMRRKWQGILAGLDGPGEGRGGAKGKTAGATASAGAGAGGAGAGGPLGVGAGAGGRGRGAEEYLYGKYGYGDGYGVDKKLRDELIAVVKDRGTQQGENWDRQGANGADGRARDSDPNRPAAILAPATQPAQSARNDKPYTPTFKSLRFAVIPYLNKPIAINDNFDAWSDIPPLHLRPQLTWSGDPARLKILDDLPVKVAWDNHGLYFMYDMTIPEAEPAPKIQTIEFWACDCLEVFIDTMNTKEFQRGTGAGQQFWFWPFGSRDDADAPGGESFFTRQHGFDFVALKSPELQRFARRTPHGYQMQCRIPIVRVRDADLTPGKIVGLNVTVETGGKMHYYWSASKLAGTSYHPDTWGDVLLGGSDGRIEFPDQLAAEAGPGAKTKDLKAFVLGEPLRIRVTDHDMNLNEKVKDKVSVTVKNPRGEREVAILEETGRDTGVFEGSVRTALSLGEKIPGVVSAYEGESLTVTYMDQARANGARNVEIVSKITAGSSVMVDK